MLQAFSYIEWPDSLEVIAEYSELLQLSVLQMVPLECLIKGLRVNAFGNMFTMMAVNSLVICVSGVAYGVRKVVIARNESLEEEEKSSKLSETKELVYRNLFFFSVCDVFEHVHYNCQRLTACLSDALPG